MWVRTMNNNDNEAGVAALRILSDGLTLGFRFLAWLNGLGVLLVLLCSAGIVELGLSPEWLRMPLSAFLAGIALAALGLLWVYPVQTSLLAQLLSGRTRKTHWVPLACVLIAYTLSLVAFVMGCWVSQGMLAY